MRMRGRERRRTECDADEDAPHASLSATPFAPRKKTADLVRRKIDRQPDQRRRERQPGQQKCRSGLAGGTSSGCRLALHARKVTDEQRPTIIRTR